MFEKGITKGKGDSLLTGDTGDAVKAVNWNVDVTLTQNRFDAPVSFASNVGGGNLACMIEGCKDKDGELDLAKVPD